MNSSERLLQEIEKLLLQDKITPSENKEDANRGFGTSITVSGSTVLIINQGSDQAKGNRKSTKKTSPLVDKVLRICQESIKWRGKSPSPS